MGNFMHEGSYTLDFSDQVKIRVGGASQSQSTQQWKGGGKVGNHTIDVAEFSQMMGMRSESFKIQIASKAKLGVIHEVIFTDNTSGKTMKGIFDSRKGEVTIGKVKGAKTRGGISSIETSALKFKLSKDKKNITGGKLEVGFAAGKAPLIVSGNAVFTYTGKSA